jgi:hypothetical protein
MSRPICDLCSGPHLTVLHPDNDPDWVEIPTLRKPDRRSPLPQPDLQPCGTNAAAKRHRRDGLPEGVTLREHCPACWEAERAYVLPHARRWREANAERERERLRRKDRIRRANR